MKMSTKTKILYFNVAKWNPSADEFSSLISLVSPVDQMRIKRFHFLADQKRALANCLLIRLIIKAILPETRLSEIVIDRTEEGRPFLKHPPAPESFDFNATHHGDYCMVIGSLDSRVGIDVMKVELGARETVDEFLSTFQDFQVTTGEWKVINECATGSNPMWAKLHAFYRLWCMKESYTKALGLGLGLDFKTINFCSQSRVWNGDDDTFENSFEENISVSVKDIPQPGWFFHLAYLGKLHPYCIAIEHNGMFPGLEEIPELKISVMFAK